MANKPLHKYTVQESNNLQVYENYKCEVLTFAHANNTQLSFVWKRFIKQLVTCRCV